MSASYTIDPDQNLFIKDYSGDVSVDDEINLLEQVFADERHRRGMNAICNYTDANLDWSLKDIDRLRAYLNKIRDKAGDCRWAVVSKGGITHLTARIFITLHEAFEESMDLKLFSNYDDAHRWVMAVRETT